MRYRREAEINIKYGYVSSENDAQVMEENTSISFKIVNLDSKVLSILTTEKQRRSKEEYKDPSTISTLLVVVRVPELLR